MGVEERIKYHMTKENGKCQLGGIQGEKK